MVLSKQRLEAINFKKFRESSLNSKYLITAICKLPSHILSLNQNCRGNLALNNSDQSEISFFFFSCHKMMKCVQPRMLHLQPGVLLWLLMTGHRWVRVKYKTAKQELIPGWKNAGVCVWGGDAAKDTFETTRVSRSYAKYCLKKPN